MQTVTINVFKASGCNYTHTIKTTHCIPADSQTLWITRLPSWMLIWGLSYAEFAVSVIYYLDIQIQNVDS